MMPHVSVLIMWRRGQTSVYITLSPVGLSLQIGAVAGCALGNIDRFSQFKLAGRVESFTWQSIGLGFLIGGADFERHIAKHRADKERREQDHAAFGGAFCFGSHEARLQVPPAGRSSHQRGLLPENL